MIENKKKSRMDAVFGKRLNLDEDDDRLMIDFLDRFVLSHMSPSVIVFEYLSSALCFT